MTRPASDAAARSELLPGNEPVRAQLLRMAESERLHPCLLFEGPSGVGKRATATWLARLVNCEAVAEARPCGRCWSCRQIPQGMHPDIMEVGLDPERTAPVISVKQARALTSALVLRPFHARRRFVIIDPAEAMTIEAANALLKTFEEPPADTGFILVTSHPSRLLATVRSRTQRVRFGPTPPDVLVPWLTQRGLADAVSLARLSEGCPGAALALADGGVAAERAARDAVVAALEGPLQARIAFVEKLTKGDRAAWRVRADRMLGALETLARDALVFSAQGQSAPLMSLDRPELVAAWAAALGVSGAGRVGEAVGRARADLDGFVNGRLVLDHLLACIVRELGLD
ncbi:MAG: DNA polymerase III subunit delta' [Myxococcota bacterium]|nr:DNA polymerase III subunit delta' [Myxococcota bacterium]